MKQNNTASNLATMAISTALIFVLQFVTIPLGAITVTLSMVPVAITAIALGPVFGMCAGAVWGLASLMKALIGASGMTSILFNMNPFFTIIICFVPRMLDGYLLAWIFRGCRKFANTLISGVITGFFAALLNTIFFMSAIVLFFGNTEYIQNMMGGQNVIIFICSIIAANAIFEMIVSAVVTGPVAAALGKARLIQTKKAQA